MKEDLTLSDVVKHSPGRFFRVRKISTWGGIPPCDESLTGKDSNRMGHPRRMSEGVFSVAIVTWPITTTEGQ